MGGAPSLAPHQPPQPYWLRWFVPWSPSWVALQLCKTTSRDRASSCTLAKQGSGVTPVHIPSYTHYMISCTCIYNMKHHVYYVYYIHVYMYIYVYVYMMYVCTYVYLCTHVYFMYICTMYICTHVYLHVYKYYVHMHICLYYVHGHVYICKYI